MYTHYQTKRTKTNFSRDIAWMTNIPVGNDNAMEGEPLPVEWHVSSNISVGMDGSNVGEQVPIENVDMFDPHSWDEIYKTMEFKERKFGIQQLDSVAWLE